MRGGGPTPLPLRWYDATCEQCGKSKNQQTGGNAVGAPFGTSSVNFPGPKYSDDVNKTTGFSYRFNTKCGPAFYPI